ncbi:hypothetical protein WA158_008494 [Blastocystis sp. Blastoise]
MNAPKLFSKVIKNLNVAGAQSNITKIGYLNGVYHNMNASVPFIKFVHKDEIEQLKKCYSSQDTTMGMELEYFKGDFKTSCILNCVNENDWNKSIDETYHKKTILIGLGDSNDVTIDSIRSCTHASMEILRSLKIDNAIVSIPSIKKEHICNVAKAISTTTLLSNYKYDTYLTEEKKIGHKIHSVCFSIPSSTLQEYQLTSDDINKYIALGVHMGNGTCFARDIANLRTDCYGPQILEEKCTALASANNLTPHILHDSDLLSNGLNLLYGVGKGAVTKPRLVLLDYNGASNPSDPYVALVGKGITFDTGGYNLKPDPHMNDMHLDKGGAAAVMGTMQIVSSLHIKKNVVGVIPLAENAIGPEAQKPNAIVKAYNGKTVEIMNTDAEGRLILADSLAYVTKNYKVDNVIDICTLTGACCVALGEYAAGAFSNNIRMSHELCHSGNECFERCWNMPILPEHEEEIKSSTEADLRSMGMGRYGGACTAAAFLKQFVPSSVNWAHLDIAGPGMYSSSREFMCKNGTGFGAQLLSHFILDQVDKAL